ncbi:MAG: hypothetical protein ABFD66_02080 [Smithella sp.]
MNHTETENLSILLCQIERKARRGEADTDDTLFLVGEVRRFMAESIAVCKAVNKLCTQIDKTIGIMKDGE